MEPKYIEKYTPESIKKGIEDAIRRTLEKVKDGDN